MHLPALCCGASLLLLVLPWAEVQPAGGEHGAQLRSLQVPGPVRAEAPGAIIAPVAAGRSVRERGSPWPATAVPSPLPSPSLSRTSWRHWGSSGRRKGNRARRTSRRSGLRTAAPSGSSRGRKAAHRGPRCRQRGGRASGGVSSPPTDGGTSPAALGRGWRGSARRRGWDATSTKPVGPRGAGNGGRPELGPDRRSCGGRGSR